jgi:hypothetical protein
VNLKALTNKVRGNQSLELGRIPLSELEFQYAAKPITIDEPAMLIRINKLYRPGMTVEALYEATRGIWTCGKMFLIEQSLDVVAGAPVADALLRVLADRQVSPTFLSSSFFCHAAILRGKFGGVNPFAIRTAALPTGRADLQGDGGRFPDSVA